MIEDYLWKLIRKLTQKYFVENAHVQSVKQQGPTVLATLLVFHEMDIHGKVMNFELLDGNAVFDQMSMRRRV